MPKRATSSGVHLRGLAPGQQSLEERCNGGELLRHCVRFDRPGNRTPDLAHDGNASHSQILFLELIESTMYLYRATNDSYLLDFGRSLLQSIETTSKTECGYATVSCNQPVSMSKNRGLLARGLCSGQMDSSFIEANFNKIVGCVGRK